MEDTHKVHALSGGFADQVVHASTEWSTWKMYLEDWVLQDVLGYRVFEAWPDCEIGIDHVDWDGISIEISELDPSIKLNLTKHQMTLVEDKGFNVVCIHYLDGSGQRFLTEKTIARKKELKEAHGNK